MHVRTPWADDHEEDAYNSDPRSALVPLGVCSAPVPLLLADVITKGAAG